ncbi:hypothetical protein Z045_24820 [Rhodococcus pyridinivorans KG-16]|uniref:Restriction endonuclease type IV Mrr domain-containing protein n=1 Tax=Rhodococcus pyridinivorans KG-16 TaxID=1441730 RepID=A0A0V9UDU2_9NOCA|nr:hypothetical protein Z045_24820 [Rhodococcus pyridinivorans KG-16]
MVAIVHQHLADLSEQDTTVTESKMLIDAVSGQEREVDTCVEALVAGQRIVISIECRDHARPQTIGFIEEMKSKHEFLPTNRLLLVSSSGFTASARARAKDHNIGLVQPGPDLRSEVEGKLNRVWVKSFALSPRRIKVNLEGQLEGEGALPENDLGDELFLSDGTQMGSLRELVEAAITGLNVDNDAMRDALEGEGEFEVGLDLMAAPDAVPPLYLRRKGSVTGPLHRVRSAVILGRASVKVAPMDLTSAVLRSADHAASAEPVSPPYAHGRVVLGDKEVLFVVTEGDGDSRTQMRVKPATK